MWPGRKAGRAAAWMVGLLLMQGAGAVGVRQASPQGVVGQVRQVSVSFTQPVIPLGELRGSEPFDVRCQGPAPKGQGRWANERTWVYDFESDLPPGVRCEVAPRAGWKPPLPAAGTLQASAFRFQTGGPAVRWVEPAEGEGPIDEAQAFLLQLTGEPDLVTVAARAHCLVEGIGERMPVRLIQGAEREAVLKARNLSGQRAAQAVVLSCQRPLPAGAEVKLVWGAGVAAKGLPTGVTTTAQSYGYTVRPAFTAEFSCERERANRPCLPVRPMSLRFSAPVPRELAQQIRLQPDEGPASKGRLLHESQETPKGELVDEVRFEPPLKASAGYRVTLPAGLVDETGRPLTNAGSFPLKVVTGVMPPLAKFAAAPFGVIELHAEPGQPPVLPVTVRQVEQAIPVRSKTLTSAQDILDWLARVRRYHESQVTAREAGLPAAQWKEWVEVEDARGRKRKIQQDRWIATRELSLLSGEGGVKPLQLPRTDPKDPRPFEVVGIPLGGPGYHVIELASPRLGEALLPQAGPMYVRTGVLATNLSVHFKHGRENALVWVTSLDKGQPVAGAEVAVHDCAGTRLWQGRTDAKGLAQVDAALTSNRQGCALHDGLLVLARKPVADGPFKGQTDVSFVFSGWQKGIEPWRFQHPTQSPEAYWGHDGVRAHTVFDRSLFRAGETVSMKHFLRFEQRHGLTGLPKAQWPDTVKIVHQGSDTEYRLPLAWRDPLHALSTWPIPEDAKLGRYEVSFEGPAIRQRPDAEVEGGQGERRSWAAGSFRVEAFRVPLVEARLTGPKGAQVAPRSLPLSVQMRYLAGGAMQQAAGQVTAVWRERTPRFADYDGFSFSPPREWQTGSRTGGGADGAGEGGDDGEMEASDGADRVLARAVGVLTDREGQARVTLDKLPDWRKHGRPGEVQAELTFTDPNGEVQTVATRVPVWPSEVVLGVASSRWAGSGSDAGQARFRVVALDTAGKPLRGQRVKVGARMVQHYSHRKRIVGGFYAYDNRAEVKDLGTVCEGQTDARGLLLCETRFDEAGEVELIAQAQDSQKRAARAATSIWVTRQGEVWFSQDNDDRMDVLPEKPGYEPGETARLQVRMPFREATVLVSVEREGVIDTRVMTLRGDDPVIALPIPKSQRGADGELRSWAPNVYVSVMALRGRIREVPWYSFFTWGWRSPVEWARAFWYEGRSYQAPTALVDLSRPAYKLGVAALRIGRAEHALKVEVMPEKAVYGIRETARTRIRVTHDGKPVTGSIAFAAVDEGLLALSPNRSWDLLDAMLQERAWGVETSTAQSEVVGRRHYGRKAVAPGGGGGGSATRELLDTLLLWQGDVALDARGEAVVSVPINDALTRFRLVAVAASGLQRFGTGQAEIRVTQDLQVLPGLPPLVREGDRFEAILTVRNTTSRALTVQVGLRGEAEATADATLATATINLPTRQITVAPEGAQEVRWPVDVPLGAQRLAWVASAATSADGGGKPLRDQVRAAQVVEAAVPVRVWQATLVQAPGGETAGPQTLLAVAPPGDAVLDKVGGTSRPRGGLRVSLHASLAGAMPGVRRYFETYPFACLEQKVAKGLGLALLTGDAALWNTVVGQLPSYLDEDGLAAYFPPSEGAGAVGSDYLTAHLLSVAHQAGRELPPQAREAMLAGLAAFVRGELGRDVWAPSGLGRGQVNDARRLAAIEALARYGRAEARWLDTVQITPQAWPTSALLNWMGILQRVSDVPQRAQRLAEAEQLLRARLMQGGTTLSFANEQDDFWWWMMESPDANAVRLILAVLDRPDWRDDLPRLVQGALARQRQGAWLTTHANLWGVLAVQGFARRFEAAPVTGRSVIRLGETSREVNWSPEPGPSGVQAALPWPVTGQPKAAPAPAALTWQHRGTGRPWAAVQTLAAVPLKAPLQAGYAVRKTITPVDAAGEPVNARPPYARGTILRVTLELNAQADMSWVALQDPVPGGATVLGSGLGRDSALATQGERRAEEGAGPIYVERSFSAYRAYFDFLPKGRHVLSYSVRLNNPGRFALPPTRVEAMYAPETFGELPNGSVEVAP